MNNTLELSALEQGGWPLVSWYQGLTGNGTPLEGGCILAGVFR